MRRVVVLAVAALLTGNSAASTCGAWVPQTNGISLRVCTDAQNQRYCEMKERGKIIRVRCPE